MSCSPVSFRVFAFFVCVSAVAQDTNELQARQLYYKSKSALAGNEPAEANREPKPSPRPKPHPKRPERQPSPLGLKFTIEQENSSGGSVPVDVDKTFATGDAIRLRIEVNNDAYVYLLSRGASGEGSFLFPESGEDNRLKAFQSVQVPAKSADPIRFAEPAGTETLYIFVSRSPVPDLKRTLTAKVAEHLQSRDLVRGKSNSASEHALYTVNVSATPGAQVLQKVELKHR